MMRHIGPIVGLLLLAACDKGGDAPSNAPDRGSEPSVIATPSLPSTPAPASAPAAIRVAEGAGASGQANSRILSPDQRLLPLSRILSIAAQAVPGEVISVELDADDDVPEYEVKILTQQGRMIEIEIAARTGEILKIEDD